MPSNCQRDVERDQLKSQRPRDDIERMVLRTFVAGILQDGRCMPRATNSVRRYRIHSEGDASDLRRVRTGAMWTSALYVTKAMARCMHISTATALAG